MGGVRAVLVAAVAGVMLAGCAGDGAAPSAGGGFTTRAPSTGDRESDDLLRYSEYIAGLTHVHECWSGVMEQIGEAYLPLIRFGLDQGGREGHVATARQSIDRATAGFQTCSARYAQLRLPALQDAQRRDSLLRLRAMEDEANTQVQAQIGIVRIQADFVAGGGTPHPPDLFQKMTQAHNVVAQTEVRHREARAATTRGEGQTYNQVRIHALKAQVAMYEHAAQFANRDAALLTRGLQETAGMRSSLVNARAELMTLARRLDDLPANLRPPGQRMVADMRALCDLEEKIAAAMDDYFRSGERNRTRPVTALLAELKAAQDRTVRNVPDALKRILGLTVTA